MANDRELRDKSQQQMVEYGVRMRKERDIAQAKLEELREWAFNIHALAEDLIARKGEISETVYRTSQQRSSEMQMVLRIIDDG